MSHMIVGLDFLVFYLVQQGGYARGIIGAPGGPGGVAIGAVAGGIICDVGGIAFGDISWDYLFE